MFHIEYSELCGSVVWAAELNWWSAQKKGIWSVSNLAAQPLKMEGSKSLGSISGMILNQSLPKFASKMVANEKPYMLESCSKTCIDWARQPGKLWISIQRFFEQSAIGVPMTGQAAGTGVHWHLESENQGIIVCTLLFWDWTNSWVYERARGPKSKGLYLVEGPGPRPKKNHSLQ